MIELICFAVWIIIGWSAAVDYKAWDGEDPYPWLGIACFILWGAVIIWPMVYYMGGTNP